MLTIYQVVVLLITKPNQKNYRNGVLQKRGSIPMSIIYGILGQLVGGCFRNQITNPFEICCSFKYVKSIDYDVVLNARKSTQVSSENVANMLPIYEFSSRRAGFKIQYPSGCVGSSPTLGTTLKPSS